MQNIKAPQLVIIILLLVILVGPMQSRAGHNLGTRHSLQLVVEVAASGLGGLLRGVTSSQEQIEMVAKFIQPVRFFSDSSGYFFVYDIQGVCVAHATQPEIVGKDLFSLQDSNGQFVIQQLISTAQKGGGFVEYNWKKPSAATAQDKLGYVAPILGTKLFIGSGIYFSSLNQDSSNE